MRLVLFILAVLVVPLLYVSVCTQMRDDKVPRPPTVHYFFLFGTVGGWLLAFVFSPSGLAAVCLFCLLTAAPIALVGSALVVGIRPERTLYHKIAIWSGVAYPSMLILLITIGGVLDYIHKH